jgi:tRNA dimethylallyltransferase
MRDGGVVVNADALQVYDAWRALTARPGPAELARAPHALYGHVPLRAAYSVGAWLRDLRPVLADAAAEGRRVVVVGGTGLYLSALVDGLAEIPPIPEAVRRRAQDLLAEGGADALAADLAHDDPATWAAIDRRNPRRVERAWEVLAATGRGLASWRRERPQPLVDAREAVRLVLSPPTEALNRRIALRLAAMAAGGGLDECRALLDRWDPRLPGAKALGAAEFVAHLRGELSLEDALDRATAATRRYAKRQRTWFRGRMRDWRWFAPDPAAAEALLDRVPRR